MGPSEKLFKKEYAKELFKIAQNDLVSAHALVQNPQVRKETCLFHTEQAVEKALKSALCHLEKPVPFTHDLYAIIQKFENYEMPPGGYALHDLTPFASIRRYEEGNYILSDLDVSQAINAANDVLVWVDKILKK